MDAIPKNIPEIIKEAAVSPLGILALMVLSLAVLALIYFRPPEPVRVRVGIFVMLFLGVCGFGSAIVRTSEFEKSARTRNVVAQLEPAATEKEFATVISETRTKRLNIPDETRINLDWIFEDNAAARTYQTGRDSGLSRYRAALKAQSGRRQQGAYRSIVAAGTETVENYLQSRGRP
jgi:hypothetical protein